MRPLRTTIVVPYMLNAQCLVVRRFIAEPHPSQRPMNRATTMEVIPNEAVGNNDRCSLLVERSKPCSSAIYRPTARLSTPDESGNYNGGHTYEAVGNNDRCSLQKLSQHILKDAQKNEQNYGRYINPEIPRHRGQYAAQRRQHGIHE